MIKIQNLCRKERIISAVFSWILLILALFVFQAQMKRSGMLDQIFNADALLAEGYYRDLFIDNYEVSGWRFSTEIYAYPDFLMYFPIRFLAGNAVPALQIMAYLQFLSLAGLWTAILMIAFPQRKTEIAAWTPLGAGLYLFWIAFSGAQTGAFSVFLVCHHTGGALTALAAVLLAVMYVRKGGHLLLTVLIVHSALAFASHKLFFVLAALPMAAAFLYVAFIRRRMRTAGAAAAALFFAVVSGFQILKILRRSGYVRLFDTTANLKDRAMESLSSPLEFLISSGAGLWSNLGGFFVSLLAVWCILLICLTVYLSRSVRRGEEQPYFLFISVWLCALIPMLLVSANIAGIVLYNEAAQTRYLTLLISAPFLTMPAGFAFLLSFRGQDKQNAPFSGRFIHFAAPILAAVSLLSIIPAARFTVDEINPAHSFSWEHSLAHCLDENAGRLNLRYGLSDYWNAKPMTIFSKTGLRVNQLHYNLYINYWINNFNWYLGKGDTPQYDFLVTERLNEAAVRFRFGEPSLILMCGSSPVYIYNRASDVRFRRQFTREGLLMWRKATGNDR